MDIVDENAGLTYRLRSATDGADGSLVRVDVDASAGKGAQTLAATGVAGVTVTMVALGWLFGATTMVLGGLGLGALGVALIVRNLAKLSRSINVAQAVASQALMEAEDQAERGGPPRALPPS